MLFRSHRSVRLHGAARGDEGLARDLTAEHPLLVLVGAEAPEQVHLELLEVEEGDEVVERARHGAHGSPGAFTARPGPDQPKKTSASA